mmetsp:Transcript_45033/g.127395  ORF Transcript_45033/g.127395 Transcript_45033/m.127395 type:complete len:222 (+) Transcript_45033:463-1128(+)
MCDAPGDAAQLPVADQVSGGPGHQELQRRGRRLRAGRDPDLALRAAQAHAGGGLRHGGALGGGGGDGLHGRLPHSGGGDERGVLPLAVRGGLGGRGEPRRHVRLRRLARGGGGAAEKVQLHGHDAGRLRQRPGDGHAFRQREGDAPHHGGAHREEGALPQGAHLWRGLPQQDAGTGAPKSARAAGVRDRRRERLAAAPPLAEVDQHLLRPRRTARGPGARG